MPAATRRERMGARPRSDRVSSILRIVLGFVLSWVPAYPSWACVGDCDADLRVTMDELRTGIELALAKPGMCLAYGAGPGLVTIDSLVTAVGLVHGGCPTPTATPSETATATLRATPSPSPALTQTLSPTETPRPTQTATQTATASPSLTPTSMLAWSFTDVTEAAGLGYEHRYVLFTTLVAEKAMFMGGVAAGDYDEDGWVDLYAVAGSRGSNRLMRNRGDGRFEDVAAAAGVQVTGERNCGPVFADYDGDGWLDLFLGGVEGTSSRLFRNRGDGTFETTTEAAGVAINVDTFSAAFGDYDRDGYLDLLVSHWGVFGPGRKPVEHFWRNRGDGTFLGATLDAGLFDLGVFLPGDQNNLFSYGFTPNFADIDSDGWPDVLMAADFGSSRVFRNQRDGTFVNVTTPVISDENGMGGAVGDYDNDGDLDWFVTSIFDPNGVAEGFWGVSGNRLYRNDGSGDFSDATEAAGVRDGRWGWGTCFADFDNDGWLDLFQVNGMGYVDDDPVGFYYDAASEYHYDEARLFVGAMDGRFVEQAALRGIADVGQGRGVACFDYDRDGDVDVYIANNGQGARLYRNDGGNRGAFLNVRLRDTGTNREAIGARVYASAGALTQMREIRAGSNFESQDPATAHFGLGQAEVVDELRVVWPDGARSSCGKVPVNRFLSVDRRRGECLPWP